MGTEESETVGIGFGGADAGQGLLEGVGQPGVLHRLPDLGVTIADRIVPHGQPGPLHLRHRIVEAHVLPDPVRVVRHRHQNNKRHDVNDSGNNIFVFDFFGPLGSLRCSTVKY